MTYINKRKTRINKRIIKGGEEWQQDKCHNPRPICLVSSKKGISLCNNMMSSRADILQHILNIYKNNKEGTNTEDNRSKNGYCYDVGVAWLTIIKSINSEFNKIKQSLSMPDGMGNINQNIKDNGENISIRQSPPSILGIFTNVLEFGKEKWSNSNNGSKESDIMADAIIEGFSNLVNNQGFKIFSEKLENMLNQGKMKESIDELNEEVQSIDNNVNNDLSVALTNIINMFNYTIPMMNDKSDLTNLNNLGNVDEIRKKFNEIIDVFELFNYQQKGGYGYGRNHNRPHNDNRVHKFGDKWAHKLMFNIVKYVADVFGRLIN